MLQTALVISQVGAAGGWLVYSSELGLYTKEDIGDAYPGTLRHLNER